MGGGGHNHRLKCTGHYTSVEGEGKRKLEMLQKLIDYDKILCQKRFFFAFMV